MGPVVYRRHSHNIEYQEGLQQKIEKWRRVLEERGLKMSRKKTEHMVFNGGDESGDVCLL